MTILGTFTKQPNEVLDYDVDYTEWFSTRSDQPNSHVVITEQGINVDNSAIIGKIVKVTLSGGVDDTAYKITVRLTTTGGIVKEGDFIVKVKET